MDRRALQALGNWEETGFCRFRAVLDRSGFGGDRVKLGHWSMSSPELGTIRRRNGAYLGEQSGIRRLQTPKGKVIRGLQRLSGQAVIN